MLVSPGHMCAKICQMISYRQMQSAEISAVHSNSCHANVLFHEPRKCRRDDRYILNMSRKNMPAGETCVLYLVMRKWLHDSFNLVIYNTFVCHIYILQSVTVKINQNVIKAKYFFYLVTIFGLHWTTLNKSSIDSSNTHISHTYWGLL